MRDAYTFLLLALRHASSNLRAFVSVESVFYMQCLRLVFKRYAAVNEPFLFRFHIKRHKKKALSLCYRDKAL